MLQSDFFDKETEALIDLNVIYGAGKHITDKCMIIFSKEIHTYLVSHYKCEIIGEIGACNGNISIYCLDYKGEKIAFYLTGIGSAVASSMCYESHHVIGATKYIMFGSYGSLDKETTRGKFIIPTESYGIYVIANHESTENDAYHWKKVEKENLESVLYLENCLEIICIPVVYRK